MEALDQVFGSSYNPGDQSVGKPKNELGQDDFFRLMVAQLNNQDPTKPLDNAEFLGQLAQFSTVNGIEDMNESFSGLVNNLFTSQAMMAAQLIDREVLIDAGFALNSFFDGENPVSGGFIADDATTSTRVNIYDGSGELVNSIDMGTVEAGSYQFAWNGTGKDGNAVEQGRYTIVAEGNIGGQLNTLVMQQYNKINSVSVDRQNTSVLLHLDNGEDVTFSQVSEFR
ncbi:MAG: flagellar hook assembly protein FlgD [Gammaproteobacteria bacterium]|nr:flagellar hook assembly protein FlgD [Gammaproteobacteria bacterium]